MFISYNGLLDPLGPSQILPYVERLARRRAMHLVSFERVVRLTEQAESSLRTRLEPQGIGWTPLRYRKRPTVLAKALDLWDGVRAAKGAIKEAGADLIHARGYMPMEIALRSTSRLPVLFDIRGLQGEEYVDAGVWTRHSLEYLLLKRAERTFFRRAAGAVVLTRAIEPYVRARFAEIGRDPPLEVIPACVDLGRFAFNDIARARFRLEWGLGDALAFVYSGSLGTWYLVDEMARFVRAFRDLTGRSVVMIWQLNNGAELALEASRRAGLAEREVRVVRSSPDEVPAQLSAADVGLALIAPAFSKRSSSPTKYAEYLALGLPIVVTRDVGDSGELVSDGVAIGMPGDRWDVPDLRVAIDQLRRALDLPRGRFRTVASQRFDVETVAMPAYERLYSALTTVRSRRTGGAHTGEYLTRA